MSGLRGRVALVVGGGEEPGRAIALALAARGVKVIVAGPVERALGETVGEIAYQGGKARHIVGDGRDPACVAAAKARALEVFGALDVVVSTGAEDDDAVARVRDACAPFEGRVVAVRSRAVGQDDGAAPAVASAFEVQVVALGDREPEEVAEEVVQACLDPRLDPHGRADL